MMVLKHVEAVKVGRTIATTAIPAEIDGMIAKTAISTKTK